MNNKSTTLALAFSLSACAATPVAPSKCEIPKHHPEEKTSSSDNATLYNTSPKYSPPLDEKEFITNFLSCEGNAMAETAYIESLQRRLKTTEIPPGILPCKLILDIHTQLGLVIDSCSSVKVPLNFDDSNEAKVRNFSSMVTIAKEATTQAQSTRTQIEKLEKRCFPTKTTYEL